MSIRLEMLQVARLAPKELGEATELVEKFFASKQNLDGGFGDRDGRSDVYYTVFGCEGLIALQQKPDLGKLTSFLKSISPQKLDYIHLCCLARCWACLEMFGGESCSSKAEILELVEGYRSPDGGYNFFTAQETSTVYSSFMALGAYQDLRRQVPNPDKLGKVILSMEAKSGGWGNEAGAKVGATNTTAAAVTLLHALNESIPPKTGEWLLNQAHPQGGFFAVPDAPIPDLLSTATALHALALLQVSAKPIKEMTLNFIDSLWTNEGGFHGNWADDHLDCEYTYYGLLSLGHLSVV